MGESDDEQVPDEDEGDPEVGDDSYDVADMAMGGDEEDLMEDPMVDLMAEDADEDDSAVQRRYPRRHRKRKVPWTPTS